MLHEYHCSIRVVFRSAFFLFCNYVQILPKFMVTVLTTVTLGYSKKGLRRADGPYERLQRETRFPRTSLDGLELTLFSCEKATFADTTAMLAAALATHVPNPCRGNVDCKTQAPRPSRRSRAR